LSLEREGWPRHQVNGPVPLKSADGVVRSTSDNRWWNEPPRLRPLRRLCRFFLMGAATPPLPRRGVPFGCFATFIEKSAHPEFLEVRRSNLITRRRFLEIAATFERLSECERRLSFPDCLRLQCWLSSLLPW